MQEFQGGSSAFITGSSRSSIGSTILPLMSQPEEGVNEASSEAEKVLERARMRQGIMHVRIRHFYCTLEEQSDPTLRGTSFVVGTGTGRPNEPGRVIDASPSAIRFGITPGMPLRRAHRIAPRTRFLPPSYELYQPVLQQLRDRYHAYSRIVESVPIADAFIDLRGCELSFSSPVMLADRLQAEINKMGLNALIGVSSGKAIAEMAALVSRKEGRQGVLYVPHSRESSFVQTLPISLILHIRSAGLGIPGMELQDQEESPSRLPEAGGRNEGVDPAVVAEAISHLRDFGITTFAQLPNLTEEALRRLGLIGSWLYHITRGEDESLVIPDAPPLSQNARIRFQHAADADETCAAIRKLSNYLGGRLKEQRLKGQELSLILWPSSRQSRETRQLYPEDDSQTIERSTSDEALGGQINLARETDEADVLAHQGLMLFAQHHRPGTRYLQVQLRVGDISSAIPQYYPPLARSHTRLTRKL